MEFMVEFLIGAVLQWVILLVVIPVASKIAGFSFPGIGEAAWKLAVVVLFTHVVAVGMGPLIGFGATLLNVIIFWTAMVKWFHVDFFGAIVIIVINFMLSIAIMVLIGSMGCVAAAA